MESIREYREELKEAWASGSFTEASIEATVLRNAENIGKIQVLEDVLQHTVFDRITEEEEDA